MAAIRREIADVEEQFAAADAQYNELSERLRVVTQERLNTEEELLAANVRLKQLLGELDAAREAAAAQSAAVVEERKMTMGELTRKVEATLMSVLDERFRDEAFTSAITDQSALSTDNVRVEFEGDEVFWSLQDNYTFEMLLQDAARYWDVAPQDAMLVDERGALWPNDAYVGLELHRAPTARIALKIKPVAASIEDEVDIYGAEGEASDDESEDGFDAGLLAIASAAEDELLLAQAKGTQAALTTKQKLALRRKLKYEFWWFLLFVICFIWSIYSRRTVKEAFRLQEAVSVAFTEEEFGDFNEKTFYDIATPEEMFDWMQGPLQEGLFPDSLYNDQPVPEDRKGYVMTYNRLVGKIRMRQLRVEPGYACRLSPTIMQTGLLSDGTRRRRQFVDYCFARYSKEASSNKSFGANESLWHPFTGGFAYSNETENKLTGRVIQGQVAAYDGSGFVRDLDATSREGYVSAVEELKQNLWVDAQTRAVIVSLNLYNGNYNYYCISQFLIEFTEGGTVVPSATNKVVSLDLYEIDEFSRINRVLVVFLPDFLTIFGTLIYFLRFLYKLYRVRRVTKSFRPMLRDSWNTIELLMLMTLGGTYFIRWQFLSNEERRNFDPFKATGYTEMSGLAAAYSSMFMGDSSTVLVLVVKALKYFALQKDLMLLQKTLVQAITDLVVFIALLCVLFMGFVLMGHNIFGMQAEGFNSIQNTLGTLFLILLGEFDYLEMQSVHPVWSFIYFIFFVIFMFFIVLNIFLAILNDAYTVVHTDVVWEELEKRKAMSLREKFEVRKAIWRERKNIARMKKLKKQKIKDAKKAKVEYEKKQKERDLVSSIGRKKKREGKNASEVVDVIDDGAAKGGVRRSAISKQKPFE